MLINPGSGKNTPDKDWEPLKVLSTENNQKEKENLWVELMTVNKVGMKNWGAWKRLYLDSFGLDEGEKLEEDITSRINKLSELLSEIAPFAKGRIDKVKQNLSDKLEKLDSKNIDENRFDQELIYYLEKQDITEEQVTFFKLKN